nr:xylulose kinase-1 [Tanacetum cinerariifolium]
MVALLYKDDHNKVAYLAKGKGCEAYEQILDFLNRSHIRYALTHYPPIVFDSLVKQFWATATVRTLEAGPSEIIATIDGNEVVVIESLIRTQLQLHDETELYEFTLNDVLDGMREIRPTFDFTAKLFSNMKLNWDGPHMPLLAPMLVVPAGGDGADAAAAGAAAANEVPPPPPPPDVPPTHTSSSTPGPSTVAHDTPVRDPTPVGHTNSTAGNDSISREDPLRPIEAWPTYQSTPFNTTTSIRPPSPTRQTSFQEDISEGGGGYVSSPKSNEAPPTTAATAAGGAEDFVALTDLSLKLDRCINRVTTLENELGVTKKVLSGVVLKLVSRVKRLEGILQQRKRRMVISDSEGEEAATKEQEIDLDALHELASTSLGGDTTVEAAYTIYKASQDAYASSNAGHDKDEVPDTTTMPFRRTRTKRRRLRKTFTSSAFEHFQENISAIDEFIPADLLTEQEQVLKNLHDYQLEEDLAKKLQAEQEAEFARQQEELAQKAQAERVASPATQGTRLSAQRRRELDAAQLIYTEADWLELMAKIATNSALSKQLLGNDVNEDNMNERLGMLLMRKRRELAEQSRVKPMNTTQQQDFVKNQSASVYNQGWTMKQVPASVPVAPSIAADVLVFAVSTTTADVSAAPTLLVELTITTSGSVNVSTGVIEATTISIPDQTASEQVYVEHIIDVSTIVAFTFGVSHATPSSSRRQLASPEQTATGKDVSNLFMAVMVCQKPLGYFSSPMIHVLRAGLVIHPPGIVGNYKISLRVVPAVPASVPAAPSIATDVSVSAVSTTTADVSAAPTLPVELTITTSGSVSVSTGVIEATTISIPDQTASEQVSVEHIIDVSTIVAFTFGVSHATPSSSRRRRKQIAKKRVTPIVDVADVDLIKFDSATLDCKEGGEDNEQCRDTVHWWERFNCVYKLKFCLLATMAPEVILGVCRLCFLCEWLQIIIIALHFALAPSHEILPFSFVQRIKIWRIAKVDVLFCVVGLDEKETF